MVRHPNIIILKPNIRLLNIMSRPVNYKGEINMTRSKRAKIVRQIQKEKEQEIIEQTNNEIETKDETTIIEKPITEESIIGESVITKELSITEEPTITVIDQEKIKFEDNTSDQRESKLLTEEGKKLVIAETIELHKQRHKFKKQKKQKPSPNLEDVVSKGKIILAEKPSQKEIEEMRKDTETEIEATIAKEDTSTVIITPTIEIAPKTTKEEVEDRQGKRTDIVPSLALSNESPVEIKRAKEQMSLGDEYKTSLEKSEGKQKLTSLKKGQSCDKVEETTVEINEKQTVVKHKSPKPVSSNKKPLPEDCIIRFTTNKDLVDLLTKLQLNTIFYFEIKKED